MTHLQFAAALERRSAVRRVLLSRNTHVDNHIAGPLYAYDAIGRLTSVVDRNGGVLRVAPDHTYAWSNNTQTVEEKHLSLIHI